jgi:hypothetical protein
VTTLALVLLLATAFLGGIIGVLYFIRLRRAGLVKLHLILALASTALVGLLVFTAPARAGGPNGLWPLGLLALATAAGYGAFRYVRPRQASEWVLAAHVTVGLASILVFLSWMRTG